MPGQDQIQSLVAPQMAELNRTDLFLALQAALQKARELEATDPLNALNLAYVYERWSEVSTAERNRKR